MKAISVNAPAKINLYLHVTGRRADGYHLLDSLFVFAKDGDVVTVQDADELSLKIVGPYAAALPDTGDNIILKAARALADEAGVEAKAAITLEKNLPVASGIGGGSTDAAAALKALCLLWNVALGDEKMSEIALRLGADVPSCLAGRAVQVAGIGEKLTDAPKLPALAVLLVNPNRPVSTPAVFKAREPVFSAAAPFTEDITDFQVFVRELALRHNDLSQAACRIEPAVAEVLKALESDESCRLARMSGSGGTCFGLFESAQQAAMCCERMRENHPEWWFLKTTVA